MDKPKSVETTLNTLRVLIFGDDTLEEIKPVSKGIGDTAKVKVLPWGLGAFFQEVDKNEEFFHIELINNGVGSWAEFWLPFEWKESNTRRSRVQTTSAENRIIRNKQAARIKEIKEGLPAGFAKHPGYAESLATDMLKAYKNGHVSKVLTILNLAEMFARFEEEDKHE